MALFWSKAWIPRKSRWSAPGGVVQCCQVTPSSMVRRMAPSVPLTHATPFPMEWTPRKLAGECEFRISNCACDGRVLMKRTAMNARRIGGSITAAQTIAGGEYSEGCGLWPTEMSPPADPRLANDVL